jgi:hypothetical protein
MSSFRRRQKAKRRTREGVRQTTVVTAAGAFLALGLFASGEYVSATHRAAAAALASAASGEGIYTGSILYMPEEGKICRQILFDNHTGLLSDNGKVDCERATYQGADSTPKQWSFARVRVISSGFREH